MESDKRKLIEIGLSYIPEDSAMARGIRQACECYDRGVPVPEARKLIHNAVPGTFGIQSIRLSEVNTEGENAGMVTGAPGFDAAENVAFTMAGWLYGEDDFGKSICTAVGFGEDTDCTAATLGALMGIIAGESGLPDRWKAPLDDRIATLCIDKTSGGIWVPETASELTERVIRTMPSFLGQELVDIFAEGGMTILCREGEELLCGREEDYLLYISGNGKSEELPIHELVSLSPYIVRYSFPAFRMSVDYEGSVCYRRGQTRKIRVTVCNSASMRQQQWARISCYMPEGVEMLSGGSVELPLNNLHRSKAEAEFEFSADQYRGAKLEFLIEVSLEGRHSSGAVRVTLMREG